MRMVSLLLATVSPLASMVAPAAVSRGKPGRIVFCSKRSGQWQIWTVHTDGSNLKQLSKAPEGAHDVDPVFSPGGKSILFTSTRGDKAGVWRMGADGSKPRRICRKASRSCSG